MKFKKVLQNISWSIGLNLRKMQFLTKIGAHVPDLRVQDKNHNIAYTTCIGKSERHWIDFFKDF